MTPATTEELAERLGVLFAALPTFASGDDELRSRAYLLALRDFSEEAVSEAIARILSGTAGLANPRFAPTPPELAALCRGIETKLRREREHLQRLEAAKRGEAAFSPAESKARDARMAEGFRQLSESLALPAGGIARRG